MTAALAQKPEDNTVNDEARGAFHRAGGDVAKAAKMLAERVRASASAAELHEAA